MAGLESASAVQTLRATEWPTKTGTTAPTAHNSKTPNQSAYKAQTW